jgi:putative endonuclease
MEGEQKINSKNTGALGEKLAKNHLLAQGYEVLELNWRYMKFEIDIIAKIKDCIVFVEVKTRKSDTFGEPQIFVSKQKQSFLIKAAQQYLEQNNITLESRFDIIAITPKHAQFTINHLERAFYPLIK